MTNKKINNNEFSCCDSRQPCCENQESMTDQDSENLSQEADKSLNNSKKLNVDIYVPLSVCACQWEKFMNLVFSVLTPYIKYINHETKDLNSDEARKLNLMGNCVIVDGNKKYTNSFALKNDLLKLLKEKGLI